MPVQRCTLTLPIPPFPLWTVQPVQSLSACTTVHFTFTCTSTPLWTVRTVQSLSVCTTVHFNFTYTSNPLWTVQPLQSLSACTTVHFTFTYNATPPMDRRACTEPQYLYNGALYLYLYLYSPVDCTDCTEPQCLYNGALYLYLYLYSPYGPYGLYRASVSVQGYTLSLPIPVLPIWTVQPVQSLSACTTVHFTFTYTSTPPMDRTACTEPQCLYNDALYLYLYLHSPYGPYSLYRASVPVQRCTLPLPIRLLPLRTYSLYRASVPVERCTLPLPLHFTQIYSVVMLKYANRVTLSNVELVAALCA